MAIKGRVLSRFPARMVVSDGLTLTKSNGVYTFGLTPSLLAELNGGAGYVVHGYYKNVLTDGANRSSELQTAINATATLSVDGWTGALLQLPVGRILSNSLIQFTKGVYIKGTGMGASDNIYPHLAGANGTSVVTTSLSHGVFQIAANESVTVEDVWLSGPEYSDGPCTAGSLLKIMPGGVAAGDQNYGSSIRNVRIRGGYTGIDLYACHSATVDHVYAHGYENVGLLVHSNPDNPDNGVISIGGASEFHGSTVNGFAGVWVGTGSNVQIFNSKFFSNQYGIVLSVTGNPVGANGSGTFQIYGNSLENQKSVGILVQQATAGTYYGQVQIFGNQALMLNDGTIPSFEAVIRITAGTALYIHKIKIESNILVNEVSNGGAVIKILDGDDVVVSGNILGGDGVNNFGIVTGGNAVLPVLRHNKFTNIPDAKRYSLGVSTLVIDTQPIVFAALPANCANGSQFYVSDGKATGAGNYTLTSGGTGAQAVRVNGAWVVGGVGGAEVGTGVATFLATPSSANLRAALTDETGTGAAVFGTAPTISKMTISGTPSADLQLNGFGVTPITIANGSSATIGATGGSAFIRALEANGFTIAEYAVGGGSVVQGLTVGSKWVAPTTTPAAGKCSINFDGVSDYKIYNNIGSSVDFYLIQIGWK